MNGISYFSPMLPDSDLSSNWQLATVEYRHKTKHKGEETVN